MKSLITYIKERFVVFSMVFLACFILAATLLTWYNKKQLVETARIKSEAEEVKYLLEGIFERTLRSMDLGVRGYALTHNQQLLSPYDGAVRDHPKNMERLDSLMRLQHLDSAAQAFVKIKTEIAAYIRVVDQMLTHLNTGEQEQFLALMNADKGYEAWVAFAPFFSYMTTYENALIDRAQADYEKAMNRNLIVQVLLMAVGVTILLLIATRLRREERMRNEIFESLRQSSYTYLFHPGQTKQSIDQTSIISETVDNFKQASQFISSIANADYSVSWNGLTAANEAINQQTLAGQLHKMKDQLIRIRAEEEKRNWMNQGLTQYSEVVRKFQNDLDTLCFESVRFIVRYLKAQQAGLFTVDESEGEKSLILAACYAFERKKYLEKKLEPGVGLVGQVYLEGQTVRMTNLPKEYALITSGLGGARPASLIVVPMKHNEEVVAILELASLAQFEQDHVQFVERCGEFLAAALANSQTNNQVRKLLEESQMQTESMKSQEEEMRQNMEELSATQEEMLRKEREYVARIQELESRLTVTA